MSDEQNDQAPPTFSELDMIVARAEGFDSETASKTILRMAQTLRSLAGEIEKLRNPSTEKLVEWMQAKVIFSGVIGSQHNYETLVKRFAQKMGMGQVTSVEVIDGRPIDPALDWIVQVGIVPPKDSSKAEPYDVRIGGIVLEGGAHVVLHFETV